MCYKRLLFLLFLTLDLSIPAAFGQGTAFTYQGQLQQNSGAANGSFDLAFTLFGTNTGGSAIAGPVTNFATTVLNGSFTAAIDFGPGVFAGGTNWLEIAVRTNGANSFATLQPRQFLAPVPYAIFANTASNLSGTIGNASLPANANFSGSVTAPVFQSSVNGTFIAGAFNTATGLADASGGGTGNAVSGNYATVSGGRSNKAQGVGAVVAGGGYDGVTVAGNVASGNGSAISGGNANTASGLLSVVSGGNNNVASNSFATVPGGQFNTAGGTHSFAAGRKGQALHNGSFVWADETDAYFSSTANNQFLIRAQNGVGINTNNPNGMALSVNGNAAVNGDISASGNINATFNVNAINVTAVGNVNALTVNASGNVSGQTLSGGLVVQAPIMNASTLVSAPTISANNVTVSGAIGAGSATVTTTLSASNVTINGDSAVGTPESPTRILYGRVNADGSVAYSGGGVFGVAHGNTGLYRINYGNAFSSPPAVTVTIVGAFNTTIAFVALQDSTGFQVDLIRYGFNSSNIFSTFLGDDAFNFIAIGPR